MALAGIRRCMLTFIFCVVFVKIKESLGGVLDWLALIVAFASVLKCLMAAASMARTDVTHYI